MTRPSPFSPPASVAGPRIGLTAAPLAVAGLILALLPTLAAAQVRLVSYGPASATANAFALTVSDDEYDDCFDEDPPDPANPPSAFFAEC